MRLLTLVRHAKSAWADPGLKDFDRPLDERGRRDAPRMAQRALETLGIPDRLVSSPALRALTTARVFAETFALHDPEISVQRAIYEASPSTLLTLIQQFDDRDSHIMMFGHNPGFTELAQLLANCPFDNLPTCAVVQIGLEIRSWREAKAHRGQLRHFLFPKQIRA